ncbi:OmpH family outer membrane protein [Marinibaculum pumilum]|uniref:OmpH family outer membrane protein n=1 Tax=Marinibaculum pumilum TaxID=1766165 RepID=A0ABV7KU30_9PROT
MLFRRFHRPHPAAIRQALLHLTVLLCLGAVLVAGAAPAALAQKLPPTVIAIIDTPKILRQSKAGQAVARQVEQYSQDAQKEIAAKEQSLRKKEETLSGQRNVLSQEAFQREAQSFQKDVGDMQRQVQQRKIALDQSMAQGNQQIFRVIEEILKELAREMAFDLVLERTQVAAIVNQQMEITQEVLRRLDQKLPTVTVPAPQTGQ